MKKILFVCLTVSLFISACKKDKSDYPITTENIAGTYQVIAMTSTPDYEQPIDQYSDRNSCEKDDLIYLKLDGSYVYEDAGVNCGTIGPSVDEWKLVGNKIFVYGNEWGSITNFDRTILELTRYDKDIHATLIVTLKRQ